MSLLDEQLFSVRDRTLEVRCPSVRLTQRGVEAPRVHSGPGLIRMHSDGQLELTTFVQQVERPSPSRDVISVGAGLGEFIPESDYVRLEAVDEGGAQWRCERVPLFTPFGVGGAGAILSVNLPWLTRAIDHREFRYSDEVREQLMSTRRARLRFFEELPFPANVRTVVRTERGEQKGFSTHLDAAQVDVGGLRITLGRDQGVTTLTANSDRDLPHGMLTHLGDALAFILGRPLWADIEEVHTHGVEEVTIRPHRKLDAKVFPPVPNHVRHAERHAWQLFALYLTCLLQQPTAEPDDRAPLAGIWHGVLTAGGASIETQALVWSVAVESVLALTVPDAPAPDDYDPLTDWRRVALDALASAECPTEARLRIVKLFDRLDQPPPPSSPAAKLRALVAARAIHEHHRDAWTRLRHRSAHGALDIRTDPLQVVRDTTAVLALLYLLILRAVGYSGLFADFAVQRWPTWNWPTRDQVPNEMAVEAEAEL